MEKVKSMWSSLSKRGKIFAGGVIVIVALIIINWIS